MARPERHPAGQILDGARAAVVAHGLRGATLAAIAEQSGAPVGSIYHRFGSVDELLVRLWLRAVRASHAALEQPTVIADPVERVVACALATYDFCLAEREDALLLATFSRRDLRAAGLSPGLRAELESVNAPIERALATLAHELFSRRDRAALDLALLAVVDIPSGFARRHVDAGTTPPPARRAAVAAAVRAVVALEDAP